MRISKEITVAVAGALAAALVGTATGGTPEGGSAAAKAKKPMKLEAVDLRIELNATDRDAGLQLFLDNEGWKRMRMITPKGKTLMAVSGRSRLRDYGLTELFFESSEPPFSEAPFAAFKKRFPEGRYRFRGRTINGRPIAGSDKFTHDLPKAPVITSPAEDATVDPGNLVIDWDPVTKPTGIKIVHYQVIVEDEKTERPLDVIVPPGTTSLSIPPEFMRPGREWKVEVVAREKSGNQILSEVPFKTA